MHNEINNKLDLLIKIANGENSAVQHVKSLHQLQMQYTIRRVIERSGLHKKLSVNYQDVIEDIEQEAWIKLIRKLKNTPDFAKDDWLLNTKLVAILIKFTTDCALYYTGERGKKRNQKVGKNIPDGAPIGFVSLEKATNDEPSSLPAEEVLSAENFINNERIETDFFENLDVGTEKEIIFLLIKGHKRKEIVNTLNITLYKYNQTLNKIKTKAQELHYPIIFSREEL